MLGINAFTAVTTIATVTTGPGGGLLAQHATRVFSGAAYQLLQNAGQQFGLSQRDIDLAHSAFSGQSAAERFAGDNDLKASIRDAGQEFGASSVEIDQHDAAMQDILRQAMEQASDSNDFKDAKARGRGQGWLMAMAKALGAQLDQLGAKMENMAQRITKDTPGLSAEFSVVTQQFGMLMNAASNGIKTVGEAMGRMASKQ